MSTYTPALTKTPEALVRDGEQGRSSEDVETMEEEELAEVARTQGS